MKHFEEVPQIYGIDLLKELNTKWKDGAYLIQ